MKIEHLYANDLLFIRLKGVEPMAMPRPRLFGSRIVSNTKNVLEYKRHLRNAFIKVASEYRDDLYWDEQPIRIDLKFYLTKKAKSPRYFPYVTKKPDSDNLVKPVLDCLEGVFFTNDSQVCMQCSMKYYALESNGIIITMKELKDYQ